MNYLRNFAPWLVYAGVSVFNWQLGALSALVFSLYLVVQARRAGVEASAQILDFGTLLYALGLTVLAFTHPHSSIHEHDSAISSAWLALIGWASLALRNPFTLGIARRSAPKEVWNAPHFIRINTVITMVWTVGFTLSAAGEFTCSALGAGSALQIFCKAAGFVVPAIFTARYVKKVRARVAAKMAAMEAAAPAAPAAEPVQPLAYAKP
ncbi:hypothetical protein AB0I22_28910 [Streptomyces sp. NPDC050610]|uniref:hypothetical protein n=1 Tax=Streptomyces sp. NPDC050610 TaxID=3157097 RepID=UPI00343ADA28